MCIEGQGGRGWRPKISYAPAGLGGFPVERESGIFIYTINTHKYTTPHENFFRLHENFFH